MACASVDIEFYFKDVAVGRLKSRFFDGLCRFGMRNAHGEVGCRYLGTYLQTKLGKLGNVPSVPGFSSVPGFFVPGFFPVCPRVLPGVLPGVGPLLGAEFSDSSSAPSVVIAILRYLANRTSRILFQAYAVFKAKLVALHLAIAD